MRARPQFRNIDLHTAPMTQKPPRPGFLDRPYEAGDTIPAPESMEVNSPDVWEAWHALNQREMAQFANTAPMSDLPVSEAEAGFAATQPASLPELRELRQAQRKPKGPTLEEVMVEARLFNRVCPVPLRWNDLYLLLPNKVGAGATAQPAPPLAATAWATTPALAKRMVFREHLEWADRQGVLGQVMAFLRTLPEDEWYHMGD